MKFAMRFSAFILIMVVAIIYAIKVGVDHHQESTHNNKAFGIFLGPAGDSDIYRFKDGDKTCYVAVTSHSTALTCF